MCLISHRINKPICLETQTFAAPPALSLDESTPHPLILCATVSRICYYKVSIALRPELRKKSGRQETPRSVQKLEERDFFTDHQILKEPYQFFEAVRKHGPVWRPPGKDYLIVTGFDEALQVLKNHQDFSAVIGVAALPPRCPSNRTVPTLPNNSRRIDRVFSAVTTS